VTKAEIVSLVVLHTNRSDKTELMERAIDLALKEICLRHGFQKNCYKVDVAVTTDDTSFTLPTDCLDVVDLRIKNDGTSTGEQIDIITRSQMLKKDPELNGGSQSGKPILAWQESNTLQLYPKVNNDYTLELGYFALEALEEDSTSTNVAELDDAIVSWVTHYVYKSINMIQESAVWKQSYETAIKHAKINSSSKPGEIRQMQGAKNYGNRFATKPIEANVEKWLP